MKIPTFRLKTTAREEGEIHALFEISIVLKGVGAALETALGFALLYSGSLITFIFQLLNNELIDDPNDFFATHAHSLLSTSALSHSAQIFGALYLISHGVVKLFLIAGLLRNKLWAYPASLAVFSLFIFYQLVRFTRTHSVWLLVLTLLDIIIMWLIWHEYTQVRKRALKA